MKTNNRYFLRLAGCFLLVVGMTLPTLKAQTNQKIPLPKDLKRPVPNSISYEIPESYRQAVAKGTRSKTGAPGAEYWQQYSQYQMDIKLIPETKRLEGVATITYHNNSPDTLRKLYFELNLNYSRTQDEPVEKIDFIQVAGDTLSETTQKGMVVFGRQKPEPGYKIQGTNMIVRPLKPILPKSQVSIKIKWHYTVPVFGSGYRMGHYNKEGYFYLAYWYPQIRVYDDVNGWFTTSFKPRTEFYHEFADYDVKISIPEQWVINATGVLKNAKDILKKPIYKRLKKAYKGSAIVQVVGKDDFGAVTVDAKEGYLTWHYKAEQVNDFTFSATKNMIWDATRTSVGDRDGDGEMDYSNINAVYFPEYTRWKKAARYAQDAIHFLSKFTGLPYPWPHMTAVSSLGGGSGMEYPMMTLVGSYQKSSDYYFYRVMAHELAHMWTPLQLASNERRFAWQDEGHANFMASQAIINFQKVGDIDTTKNSELSNFNAYLRVAGTDREDPIIRWSQYYFNGGYTVASYYKPASALISLRSVLGEEVFTKAYHTYMKRWQFKHPYPWDMFRTFEAVSGENLDWFWRSWYYTTWTIDRAVSHVEETANGTVITIKDFGNTPLPVTVEMTLENGDILTHKIGVETWLHGAVETSFTISPDQTVTKVVVDPEYLFPDVNRENNTWKK